MREIKNLPVQFMDRAGAYAVDMIIVFFFILLGIFQSWNTLEIFLYTTLAYSVFTIIPTIWYPGQSLGKLSTKTIVLTSDYKQVPIFKYILRSYFIALTSVFSLLLYQIIAMILLDKRLDKRMIIVT